MLWVTDASTRKVPGATDMLHGAFFSASFMKGMSTPGTDDFTFLEEHEWRIFQTDRKVTDGRIVATNLERPRYRVVVGVADVKLIVVPDEVVRMWTMTTPWFASWANGRAVPVLTAAELKDF